MFLGLNCDTPIKKNECGTKNNVYVVGNSHKKKEGTPTMGGLIFIIATFITTLYFTMLLIKLNLLVNLMIILLLYLLDMDL